MAQEPRIGHADLRVLRKVAGGAALIFTEVAQPKGGLARVYEMTGEQQARARAESLENARLIKWVVADGIGRAEATEAGRRAIARAVGA